MGQRALSDDLNLLLKQLGTDLDRGRLKKSLLLRIQSHLNQLPPESVGTVAFRLPGLAGLYSDTQSWKQRRRSHWLWKVFPAKATDLHHLQTHPELALPFLFHGNGYIREAAIHQLVRKPQLSAFALSGLLYRLNDWVAPIRATASASVRPALFSAHPEAAAAAVIWLALQSSEWGRWEDRTIIQEALAAPGISPAIGCSILAARRGPWARALRSLLAYPQLDAELLSLSREAKISHVRVVATQALVTGYARWPTGFRKEWVEKVMGRYRMVRVFSERALTITLLPEEVAVLAAADRSANVRKVAADALVSGHVTGDHAQAIIAKLRDDQNPGVRERIAFVIRSEAKN